MKRRRSSAARSGRRARRASVVDAQRGLATIEMVLCFPVFLVLLGLVVDLGWGSVLRQRTLVAARTAAWQSAISDEAPSDESLRKWIGSPEVRIVDDRDEAISSFLTLIEEYVPLTSQARVRLVARVDMPLPRLLTGGEVSSRSSLMRSFWSTEPDEEGLFGFLADSFGQGIPQGFGF